MEEQTHAAKVEARLRARRAERRAELLKEARDHGRRFWWSNVLLWMFFVLLGVVWLWWREPPPEGPDTFTPMLWLFVLIIWLEDRLSRRLDAVVKLLEEDSAAP
jgi:hypothetical protein